MSHQHSATIAAKALAGVLLFVAISVAPFASAVNVDPVSGMVTGAPGSISAAERVSEVALAHSGRQLQQACTDTCKALPKMPVCGTDGKSYDNACYPACTGAKIKYMGKCSSKPCLCAPLYAPVCGGGKTYINSCFAKCAGASSYKDGYCGSDCQCPSTKATVCGFDGKSYDNSCKATCAGTVPYYSGACDTRISTCKCATTNDPVCVTTYIETKLPTGTIKTPISTTFASPCLAQCQTGAKTWTKGACKEDYQYDASAFTCGCSSTLKPVCGQYSVATLNLTATMSSKCVADCLGYKTLYDGICKNECLCPFAADPVCVGKKTYKSACLARCQGGATTWTKGACTPCTKCPTASFDTYVCGKDGVPYGNQCLAECVGAEVAYKGFCGAAGKRLA